MAVKSVVDIDVNDEAFKRFKSLFDEYNEELHKQSEDWSRSDTHVNKIRKAFAGLLKETEEIRKKSKETKSAWEGIGKLFKESADNAGKIAERLKDAGSALLRWGGTGGLLGGLIGAGSLWGLDSLASGVGAGRRSALGLGLSYGEQSAFNLNFGRVVDSQTLLSSVAAAMRDPSQRYALYGAGLTESDLQGKDTAQISAAVLAHVKQIADTTNPALYGSVIQARGLGMLGFDVEALQRLHATPANEIGDYFKNYAKDQRALGLDPGTQRIWQDFQIQLERAGSRIETVFVKGLEPLIPPLGQLSAAVEQSITTLMTAAKQQHWIEQFGEGIKWLAKEITTGDFQKGIVTFVTDIGTLATSLHGVLIKLGWAKDSTGAQHTIAGGIGDLVRQRLHDNGFMANDPDFWRSQGFVSDTKNAQASVESGGDPFAVSGKGAMGKFQLMPGTAAHYHVNPFDPLAAERARNALMTELYEHYQGDPRKTLAGYNWGQTKLDREIARYGADWFKHIPAETAKYVSKVISKAGMKIEINNNTGGSAVVSSSQIGAPK